MARFYPLFSSSEGNAYFIGSKNAGILVDVGVSYKKLFAALSRFEIDISAVKALFITHEHSDHIKGVKTFHGKNPEVPIFAKELVADEIRKKYPCVSVKNIAEIEIIPTENGEFSVKWFQTSHDSSDSCGYVITLPDEKKCAICTDLGIITDEILQNLYGAELVLLESNYDVEMLRNSDYSYYIKQRIFSKLGHLSNDDCAKALPKLVKNGTTRLVLGHISQNNNTMQNVERTAINSLFEFERNSDYTLTILEKEFLGKFITF